MHGLLDSLCVCADHQRINRDAGHVFSYKLITVVAERVPRAPAIGARQLPDGVVFLFKMHCTIFGFTPFE